MESLKKIIMVEEKIIKSAIIEKLVNALFMRGAVKINTATLEKWADRMAPIYINPSLLISQPHLLGDIIESFYEMKGAIYADNPRKIIIAGIENAGSVYAGMLSRFAKHPMCWVRDKPKEHGLYNRIEGLHEEELQDKEVLVIESVVSVGGRAAEVVEYLRGKGAIVNHCLALFNYDLANSKAIFKGEAPYAKANDLRLSAPCEVHSLLSFADFLHFGVKNGHISAEQEYILKYWHNDPEKYSEDWIKKNRN
jgi:orotate phosphoribosyltransferase